MAEWYKKDLKSKGLEVVFVSSDKDEEAFKEYFSEQPWLALDYADRKRKEQLSNKFGVSGIPSFIIVGADGTVINKDGRTAVTGDPTGVEFPWYPKPVHNLKDGPGNIQEAPTVCAFCETSDAATQKAIEEAMAPLAQKYLDEAKAEGEEEPKLAFSIVTSSAGLSGKLRGMFSLPVLPPSQHEHPLVKKEEEGARGWGCDGCGQSGDGKERYRCAEGCDFDFCGECNAKVGSTASYPPKLMLVDIPENGGFYEGPEGEVAAITLEKFVTDYLGKTLERKQLG